MPGGITQKSVERLRAPLQKLITRAIAPELHLHVLFKRIARAGEVDLDRVIDHQIDRHQRLDDAGVFPKRPTAERIGEIDEQRNAGKVLQQHARTMNGISSMRLPFGCQLARSRVVFRNLFAVAVSQHGFKNDAQAVRQSRNRTDAVLFELRK